MKNKTNKDYHINNALISAAVNGRKDTVELLIKHGATDIKGATHFAVQNGKEEIAELLKKHNK